MAQIATATTGIANMDINTLRATINAIRSRIAASRTIRAQDVLDLIWVYNMWVQHTHNVTDYYWAAYGNTSPYGTTAVTRGSYAVNGLNYMSNGFGAGNSIDTNVMRTFAALVNSIKTHTHLIDDGSY